MLLSLSPNSPSHEASLSLLLCPFCLPTLIFPPSPLSLWFPFSQYSPLIISSPGFEHIIALAKKREQKKTRLSLSKIAGKKNGVSCLTFFLLQYIIVVWQDQRGASVAYIKTRPRHLSIMIWKRRGLRQNAGNHNITAICRSCAIQSAAGFNRSLNWHIAHEEGSAAPPSLSCYRHTHTCGDHILTCTVNLTARTHIHKDYICGVTPGWTKADCSHLSVNYIFYRRMTQWLMKDE